MLSTKYSNISGVADRDKAICICKENLGTSISVLQLKMFFTELMFLNKYAKKGDTIICVGAAPGFHTGKLAELFPDCLFDLWDEESYNIIPRDNINMNYSLFTNKQAEKYKKSTKGYLLMCDLSGPYMEDDIVEYKKRTIDGVDIIVSEYMYSQFKWCRTLQPRAAFLKFQLSHRDLPTHYFGGTIHLQPFSPLINETRLLVTDYDKLVEYDPSAYDKKISYHNGYNRCKTYQSNPWTIFLNKHNLFPGWDTIISLGILLKYVEKTNRLNPDLSKIDLQKITMDLFLDVLMYHRDEFWDKRTGPEINKVFGFHASKKKTNKFII